jgi:uncharacterized protein (TIGR03435 family)
VCSGVSLILTMMSLTAIAAPTPQTGPESADQFEVATIKPANPSSPRRGRLAIVQIATSPGRLSVINATLKDLVLGAYGLADYQVSGGPEWVDSARFNVEGKAPGNATREQRLLMLRALLTERFKLKVHQGLKELAIYALELGKNGPKFRPLKEDECWIGCSGSPTPLNHMRQKDLPSLAGFLTRLGSDRPVLDKTGLKGSFAVDVDMSKIMDSASQADGGRPPTNTGIFDAMVANLPDGLGLKLASTKARVEVLVIDHAEKVTEN